MLKKLLQIRFIYILAVAALLINSILFLIVGIVNSVKGYLGYFNTGFQTNEETKPALHILEGLYAIMISILFMIFGLGLGRLFIFNTAADTQLPTWLKINTFKEFKILLWETILVTLLILVLIQFVNKPPAHWVDLTYPIVVLILSMALFFVRGKSEKN